MAHRLVTAMRRRLPGGVVHVLMRADLCRRQRHGVAEIAFLDLILEGRGVGHAGVDGDVSDLAVQIQVRADDLRKLSYRGFEVALAARAEHVLERNDERLGRRNGDRAQDDFASAVSQMPASLGACAVAARSASSCSTTLGYASLKQQRHALYHSRMP